MKALGRLMSAIFPWPSRGSRRAAISDARREKERSRSSAAHAAVISRDIEHMREANHFASAIADQIMQQYRRKA
jgi:hypothetical protein